MSTPAPATTEWVPLWSLGSGLTQKPIPGEVKLWPSTLLPARRVTNMVVNGSFETNISPWTANSDFSPSPSISRVTSWSKSGVGSLRFLQASGSGSYTGIYYPTRMAVVPGTRYTLSFWANFISAVTGFTTRPVFYNSGGGLATDGYDYMSHGAQGAGSIRRFVHVTKPAPADAASVDFLIYVTGISEFLVDEVQFESGPTASQFVHTDGAAATQALLDYGLWVWADGAPYDALTYPQAAANIAPEWKTAHGALDPGAGKFRVPDLRGLTPVGLDQMPGGSRANRVTRSVAITIAARTGEETHVVSVAEMPAHAHTVNSHNHGGGNHDHGGGYHGHANYGYVGSGNMSGPPGGYQALELQYGTAAYANITAQAVVGSEAPGTNNIGGGTAHETMQPSVFVPYIVALDS